MTLVAERAAPRPGPLDGIPFAVKDCVRVAGVVTGRGSRAFADDVATRDAAVVGLLEDAGATLVATTTMHELGCAVDPAVPRAVNPRAPERTASGSSGGSAAVVAGGIVPLALGTDGSGSVRIPAAFCGVPALKPTHGSIPLDGVEGLAASLESVGIFARDVGLLARAAAVLQSRRDTPTPATVAALRLGFLAPDGETTPAVATAVEAAAGALADAGATVERLAADALAGWRAPLLTTFLVEAARASQAWSDRIPALGADAREAVTAGRAIAPADYRDAQAQRATLRRAVDALLAGRDALVLPAVDHVAHVTDPGPDDAAYWGELRWAAPFNLTGHPAVVLPLDAGGLPTALQLVGPRGGDAALLATAGVIANVLAERLELSRPC